MIAFIVQWRPYNILWRNEKTQRELLQCSLDDFELALRKNEELDVRLVTEPNIQLIGKYLAISTEKLKYGLNIEIKSCTHKYDHDNAS